MESVRIRDSIADPTLPQLREAVNTAAMQRHFAQALKLLVNQRITDCRLLRARYRPGRNCTLSYRLQIADSTTGQSGPVTISLLICPRGESRDRFIRAQRATPSDRILHLPALEAVAWLFPQDRKLPGLPLLADAANVNTRLLPEVIEQISPETRISEVSSEIISYVAERACTLRLRVELCDERSDRRETRILFAKTYPPDEVSAIWQKLQRLWRCEPVKQRQILMPQPLACDAEACAIWQSGLQGRTPAEFVSEPPTFFKLLTEVGATIAALHQTRLADLSVTGIDEIITRLSEAAALVSRIRPQRQAELRTLVQRLTSSASASGARPPATLHGDLHLKNLLATADGVALVDLDNLHTGDPAQEAGSLSAALHYQALTGHYPRPVAEQAITHFIAGWQQFTGDELPQTALHWHTAAALIYERASRSVIRLSGERLTLIDDLIALAEQSAARV
ncbi:MAG TPA: aminoglycoside phosphotransferase family protein [Blastocatellia bacterium]|nr:aminoglycoside phosphotransferase family protein [Blastocatellia bacterium]